MTINTPFFDYADIISVCLLLRIIIEWNIMSHNPHLMVMRARKHIENLMSLLVWN